MSAGNVELTLKDARRMFDGGGFTPVDVWDRLERAIRKAERALTPGRWRDFGAFPEGPDGGRCWPHGSAAIGVAPVGSIRGWLVQSPDGSLIASGPETGAEGRRKADRALSRWLKRRGVEWTGVDRG